MAVVKVGGFVRSQTSDLGVGKVLEVNAQSVVVEYFDSVSRQETREYPKQELRPVLLSPQTRCYLRTTDNRWLLGRITWHGDGEYRVALPDRKTFHCKPEQIWVRWGLPLEDPTETLVGLAQETPFFHDNRLQIHRLFVQQRAVSRGLTGLLSAKVQLYPHQIEAACRVLQDPVQRYLLADEVGLGKTIEAGIVIRQVLLDLPTGKILVLLPKHLADQWKNELDDKFDMHLFAERVEVRPHDWLGERSRAEVGSFQLLVADEAHHLSRLAYEDPPAFSVLQQLAHQTPRVLLLSATPALNHEQEFLTMLHLLDPQMYELTGLEDFRKRVHNRQEVAATLLSLKEGSPAFAVRLNVGKLRQNFPADGRLMRLCDQVEQVMDNPEERRETIRSIRVHLTETHRVYRRMIRNRRENILTAFRGLKAVTLEFDLDDSTARLDELLEEYRQAARMDRHEVPGRAEIFLLLIQSAASWVGLLRQVIETRLGKVDKNLRSDFSEDTLRVLQETPFFPEEGELLTELSRYCEEVLETSDRIDHLEQILTNLASLQNKQTRVVLFTSFTSVAWRVFEHLEDVFGREAAALHIATMEALDCLDNLERFRTQPKCWLLVCDRSGEEGLNLQFCSHLVHFDLPYNPNRLEQRIGRLDRLGRSTGFSQIIFTGSESEHAQLAAWYDFLRQALGIFTRSIAGYQFLIEESLPRWLNSIFDGGPQALENLTPEVVEALGREGERLEELHALDEQEGSNDLFGPDFFASLAAFESDPQTIQGACNTWLLQTLNFGSRWDGRVLSYRPRENTLVPLDVLAFHLGTEMVAAGTYDRETALRLPDIQLFRLGNPLMDVIHRYLHWDDRGRAFAMWRVVGALPSGYDGEFCAFRFNYLVEARVEGSGTVDLKALSRRCDGYLPPSIHTVYCDLQGEPIEDPAMLELLSRPYQGRDNLGHDYNLAKHRVGALDDLSLPGPWGSVCRAARTSSEAILRQSQDFCSWCQEHLTTARADLARRVEQLRLRTDAQARQVDAHHQRILSVQLEAEERFADLVLKGIESPIVRLDSIGFIVVTQRNPFQEER